MQLPVVPVYNRTEAFSEELGNEEENRSESAATMHAPKRPYHTCLYVHVDVPACIVCSSNNASLGGVCVF